MADKGFQYYDGDIRQRVLKSSAKKRLYQDLKEWMQEQPKLTTISTYPEEDIGLWHVNLRPDEGPYAGIVFHFFLDFPRDYPDSPPAISPCTSISHPNVFANGFTWQLSDGTRKQLPYICLDMLKENESGTPYAGWTPAYSITSVLLQLQSFLFGENIPQEFGGPLSRASYGSSHQIAAAIGEARAYTCGIITPGGEFVTHTHENPWPPLPSPSAGNIMELGSINDGSNGKSPATKPTHTLADDLPTPILVSVFSYLHPTELQRPRDVCKRWRNIVIGYNLFDRSQLSCFYTKKTLDDGAIFGMGLSVKKHPNGNLKSATSPLDLLSYEAFKDNKVRTGVFGKEQFDYFLPLILNESHARAAMPVAKKSIFEIMRYVPSPPYADTPGKTGATHLQPHMILQLLTTLMNSMVVELMNDCDRIGINRHASERALEGYSSFHHLLLAFTIKNPAIQGLANKQVDEFIMSESARHKKHTPDLGKLLCCLALSSKGWDKLSEPFITEVFVRNVRWIIERYPSLAHLTSFDDDRLEKTFTATATSRRLLMFQVYFMSNLGRPEGVKNIVEVCNRYNRRLGLPTTSAKEALQATCKEIMNVSSWDSFFRHCRVPSPSRPELMKILKEAVTSSRRKRYHWDPPTGSRRHGHGGHGRGGAGGGYYGGYQNRRRSGYQNQGYYNYY